MNADESPTPEPNFESVVKPEVEVSEVEQPDKQQAMEAQAADILAIELLTELQIPNDETEIESSKQASATSLDRITNLQQQEQTLKREVATLQASYQQLSQQMSETQKALGRLVSETLTQLEQRKQSLQIAVEQLERRQERVKNEMRTTFAGASQELAIRVQGFKDYLTGSLQDLAAAAEQLELVPKAKPELQMPARQPTQPTQASPSTPQFVEPRFQSTTKQIRRLIDQYRNKPDYYGPPWQLRRTFEPIHAERVSNWFFTQAGRGALRTMDSRLQNILVGSAIVSILYNLYGEQVRALVLANTPERLGEWRRGMQDCLGISRNDFGPERGVVLFESADAVAIKAERLVKANQLPLIIIDDSEEQVSLSLLQFPLWLAFAPDPQTLRDRDRDYDF